MKRILLGLLLGLTSYAASPPAPTPLKIEIVHASADCPAYAKQQVCPSPAHWSIRVNGKPCEGSFALRQTLHTEAGKEIFRITVRADGKAPFGLVAAVGVAIWESGIIPIIEYECPREPGAGALEPMDKPVLREGKAADLKPLRIEFRWEAGAVSMKVEEGPWIASARELRDQVRSRELTSESLVILDPPGEPPLVGRASDRGPSQELGAGELQPAFPLRVSKPSPVLTPTQDRHAIRWAREFTARSRSPIRRRALAAPFPTSLRPVNRRGTASQPLSNYAIQPIL